MKSLKILQLGDIHFPDNKNELLGDITDDGAPAGLMAAINPNRFQAVMRNMATVVDKFEVRGLLICGDLTSRGNLDEYEECVRYLNEALDVGNSAKWDPTSIHVVPGNHDVNRDECDPTGIDLFQKFDPLIKSWTNIGLNVLAVNGVRSTEIKPNGHSLSVFSLNSCIGCGERRYLPEKVRNEIHNVVSALAESAPDDAFNLVYEQLDTPAFVDEHVDQLVIAIQDTSENSLPIVLAHHNALPQSVPRVEIYTELINSGRFRSRLASCRRPVIYCHGHIHDDPIEKIVDYRHPGGAVLFVSAPQIIDGFNLLEFTFARNGIPLGCDITKYRTMTPYNTVEPSGSTRVPLVTHRDIPRFDDKAFTTLLQVISAEPIRFRDVRTHLGDRLGQVPHNLTVRGLVLEAEWLSLVQVIDREQKHEHWKIRRVGP